jgi:hypothetical protein
VSRKTWLCEVTGNVSADLMPGADLPMRMAVRKAFWEVTGAAPDGNFASGWNWTLDEERAESFDRGWSKGKAWGMAQERERIASKVRQEMENLESDWDTTYSAEQGISPARLLAWLEEKA